jgi:hypothetical protein
MELIWYSITGIHGEHLTIFLPFSSTLESTHLLSERAPIHSPISGMCFSLPLFSLERRTQPPNSSSFIYIHREKGYLELAAEAVGGDGFDVIIENASDINLGSDLTVIGPGARVVVYTSSRAEFCLHTFIFSFFFVSLSRLWAIEATSKSALVS